MIFPKEEITVKIPKTWLFSSDIEEKCSFETIDLVEMSSDPGGHREQRFVIETRLLIAEQEWPIELTLTNRDNMLFRMLLGRQAMLNHLLVNPAESFLCGRQSPRSLYNNAPSAFCEHTPLKKSA